ncbi:urease accessory protein UreD [Brucella sp. BE17]|uniref:urease accessory protein UreD n=1 Tax=Brucella sp. BE17 TaxID=3142977 RepID=UPI0031BA4319
MKNDESSQAALSSQRVNGFGRLSVHFKEGRTRLDRLYQEGAAKLRMPRNGGDPLEAILINTAGGLTGGDRLQWELELQEAARALVTTQACERIYRTSGGEARIATRLKAAKGTYLAWLPQETILFDQSALSRSLDVELEEGAQALLVEATVFGRLAMGEQIDEASFKDRWRIRVGGHLVHAEQFRIGPDVAGQLSASAVTKGAAAIATVLLVSERAESLLDDARRAIGEDSGASVWQVGATSKLVARLHARDSYSLRKRLDALLALLNEKAGLPKIWSN